MLPVESQIQHLLLDRASPPSSRVAARGRKMVSKSSVALLPLILFAVAVSILLFDELRFMGGYSVNFAVSPSEENFEIHVKRPSPHPPGYQPRPAWGINGTVQCDRTSSWRADVCDVSGDVRIHSPSSTIFLADAASEAAADVERIRPYPRKFEPGIMKTVKELRIVALAPTSVTGTSSTVPACDVRHEAPALVFYVGGYTGNLFHEFTDGMVPLYLTSRRFRRQVVFVVIKHRNWWEGKYKEILSVLSDYPLVNFDGDNRTHCFPRAVVGLRSYDDLALGPAGTDWSNPARDFRSLLAAAYLPRLKNSKGSVASKNPPRRPHLVLISRKGTRGLENQREVVAAARRVGFMTVTVVQPRTTTNLAMMYGLLSTADAVVGVHGAALTHMVFMRKGAVLVQVVPLGIAWAAEACFGKPARSMGLRYVEYKVEPRESSLSDRYAPDDPVLTAPERVTKKGGWKITNDVYLANQTIRLDIEKFEKVLVHAYNLSMLPT